MQIQEYLDILKRGWWIVLAMVLIFTGLGVVFSYAQTPIYETTATFVVNPSVGIAETYDLLYSIDTLAGRTSLASTYANISQSRTIVESAAQSIGVSPELLIEYEIKTVVLPDSNLIQLTVTGPSPALAADLANAIGDEAVAYIGNLQEIYELRRIDRATINPVPVSPNHLINISLSAVVGLAGGLAFLVLRQILRQAFNEQPPTPNTMGGATPISRPPASPMDPIFAPNPGMRSTTLGPDDPPSPPPQPPSSSRPASPFPTSSAGSSAQTYHAGTSTVDTEANAWRQPFNEPPPHQRPPTPPPAQPPSQASASQPQAKERVAEPVAEPAGFEGMPPNPGPQTGFTAGATTYYGDPVADDFNTDPVIDVMQHERQSLAKQMYGGPFQATSTLLMQAEMLEQSLGSEFAANSPEFAAFKESLGSTFQRIRGMMIELNPDLRHELELYPVINRYVTEYEQQTGIACYVHVPEAQAHTLMSPYTEMALLRMLQIVLDNIRRRAMATEAHVKINVEQNRIIVNVKDNGNVFANTDDNLIGRMGGGMDLENQVNFWLPLQ